MQHVTRVGALASAVPSPVYKQLATFFRKLSNDEEPAASSATKLLGTLSAVEKLAAQAGADPTSAVDAIIAFAESIGALIPAVEQALPQQ